MKTLAKRYFHTVTSVVFLSAYGTIHSNLAQLWGNIIHVVTYIVTKTIRLHEKLIVWVGTVNKGLTLAINRVEICVSQS